MIDIDEADKVISNKADTESQKWLRIIMGQEPIALQFAGRKTPQWNLFSEYDGVQLPTPTHVVLTTATDHDMLLWLKSNQNISVERLQLPTHPDYVGLPGDFELLANVLVSEVDLWTAKVDPRIFELYDDAMGLQESMVLNITNHRVTGPDSIYDTDSFISDRYPRMAVVVIAGQDIMIHGPGDSQSGGQYEHYPEDMLGEALLAAHKLAGSSPLHILLSPAKTMRALSLLVVENGGIQRRITHGLFKVGPGYAAGEQLSCVPNEVVPLKFEALTRASLAHS